MVVEPRCCVQTSVNSDTDNRSEKHVNHSRSDSRLVVAENLLGARHGPGCLMILTSHTHCNG